MLIGIAAAAVLGFLNMMILAATGSHADSMNGQTTQAQSVLIATSVTGILIVGMALAAALTVMSVLIFVRFYRSMVTDEAYLTFTLPVTPGQLIASKLVASGVWMVIGTIALILSGWLMLTGALITGGGEVREAYDIFVHEGIPEIYDTVFSLSGTFPLFIAHVLLKGLLGYLQVTAAILFGASVARKYKALAAVGMVLLVNFAVNTVLSIAGFQNLFAFAFQSVSWDIGDEMINLRTWLIVQSSVSAVLCAFFWWANVYIAKKKLNVE